MTIAPQADKNSIIAVSKPSNKSVDSKNGNIDTAENTYVNMNT